MAADPQAKRHVHARLTGQNGFERLACEVVLSR
jgi:hypothetical protein